MSRLQIARTHTSTLPRRWFFRSLLHALILSLLLATFSVVRAQDADVGAPAPLSENEVPIVEESPAEPDIQPELRTTDLLFDRSVPNESRREELLILYQQQTEDYNEKERQFRISRAQWESLNTLASLEDVVTKTREVLVARDKVAITYVELVLDGLQRSTGIEITQKEQSLAELAEHVGWLRAHQAQSEQAINRDLVNLRADEFTEYSAEYRTDIQRALGLLAVGKIQSVVDKADAVFVRIQQYFQDNPGSVTEQVARNREFEQVRLHRQALTKELVTIRQPLENREGRNQNTDFSVVTALEKSYTATSQYLSFLFELTT